MKKPGQHGHRHTAENRARIARGLKRYNAVRRRLLRVLPGDLTAVEQGLPVRPDRVEDVRRGQAVALAVLAALGGEEQTTPQERLLLGDVGRLETLLGLLVRRALHAGDADIADLATKVATLVTARARLLGMLGLSERRVERDLAEYLRERSTQKPAGHAIDVAPVSEPAPPDDRGAAADAAGESDAPNDSTGRIPRPEGENDE